MKYQDQKDYYLKVKENDILERVRVLLDQYGYYLRDEDDKVFADLHLTWDYPWHHIKRLDEIDCHIWHRVMFDAIGGFVPSGCQDCFKVVVKPKTLEQLFALLDLQIKLDIPSKCGIEERKSVFGNYSGYFYNRGLDNGLECYKKIKEAISNDSILNVLLEEKDENGIPLNLLLKRGCTEFEHALGRSDKWIVTDEQKKIEKLINDTFVNSYKSRTQPKHVLDHVHKKWIEFAWDRGDKTVFKYTDGHHIYPPYVIYHYLVENVKKESV